MQEMIIRTAEMNQIIQIKAMNPAMVQFHHFLIFAVFNVYKRNHSIRNCNEKFGEIFIEWREFYQVKFVNKIKM